MLKKKIIFFKEIKLLYMVTLSIYIVINPNLQYIFTQPFSIIYTFHISSALSPN